MGLINPEESALIAVKFSPTQAKNYHHSLRCVFNNSPTDCIDTTLLGTGSLPLITLENNGQLYFKPTCIGMVSSREFSITNTSRVPVRYK